jgi:hypothetical protein
MTKECKSPTNIVEAMMSEDTTHEIRTPFHSQSDLLRRGWSKGLISRLLGAADWTSENPHFPGVAPMLCWRQDRVLLAEATDAFKERLTKKRSEPIKFNSP